MAGRKKKTTHSSGLYRKRITIGRGSDGKPILRAVYGKTHEELENKIAEMRVELGMGVEITSDRSKWEYWSAAWKSLTKPTVEPSTWANYETALKQLSSLNEKQIRKIVAVDIEKIISDKFAQGASKRILTLLLNTASRVFRLAKKNRVILFDPTEDVKVPQSAKVTKREAVSLKVEKMLWDVKPLPADNPSEKERGEKLLLMRMFSLIQLKCGLRREEAAPLEWSNVDFSEGTVTVDKAYNFAEKKVKKPKSQAGYRTIPIPNDYLAELKAWRAQNSDTLAGRRFVFPYKGGIISEGEFADLWTILLDGINGITLSGRIKDGQTVAEMKKADSSTPKAKLQAAGMRCSTPYPLQAISSGIPIRQTALQPVLTFAQCNTSWATLLLK